ncbi:MAG: hypothetical protein ABIT76_00175 [Chthoniobacterales bacterium]
MNWFPSFCLTSAFLAVTSTLSAQQVLAPQIEQLRQYGTTGVSSLPPDETANNSPMPIFASESPGDNDLGQQLILKTKSVYQPLTAYLSSDATYTSNVGLSDSFEQGDWFWRTSLGVNYAPRIGNYLLGNFNISQSVFRYDKFSELDFESLNIGAGLAYNLWFFYGINAGLEFNYNRLTANGYGDEIFSDRTLTLTLSRNFILSRAHYFYVVGGAEAGWSDPEQAARDEFTGLVGYHVRLARSFELDLSYRLGFYHYTEVDREDVNQTILLAARYNFTKWLSASASISGSFNQSDRTGFDYNALNTGAGFFVCWKF